MRTISFGLGFGAIGFVLTVLASGLVGGKPLPFTFAGWCLFIGLVIGVVVDLINMGHKNDEASKAEKMKNTEVFRKLIAEDKAAIMNFIQNEAARTTTTYTPNICPKSNIPTSVSALNAKLSSWGYQDLNDAQRYELILAIGQTEGYKLLGEHGKRYFDVDQAYWTTTIANEINKVKTKKVNEYMRDQSSKKKIY